MKFVTLLAGGAATLMMVMPLAIAKNVLRGKPWDAPEELLKHLNDTRCTLLESDCRRAQDQSCKLLLHQLCDGSLLVANIRNRGLEHVQRFVHLLIGDHQRHEHTNHVRI